MSSGNNIEMEYFQLNSKNEWPALYQRIRDQTIKDQSHYSEATKPANKFYNRYRDVSPYNTSRIILQRGPTDYINANLIKVEKANRKYILTQGPLAHTCSHFWLMVWEQQTKAIVMLNKLIEKKQDKCYPYWPSKIGPEHIMHLPDVGLTVEYIEHNDHSYYITRVLRLTDTESGDSKDILQFHYITWPDFGVPQSPAAFLDFLKRVRMSEVLESSVGPAVVHCSAGIGRSGTFCLVDSALVLIEKFGVNSVDVKEILFEMRKYRMGLIQTPDQLRFSYQAIIEGAKQTINQSNREYVEENHVVTSNKTDLSSPVATNNDSTGLTECINASDSEDEGPPPPPPPRLDSLRYTNGSLTLVVDRPLPNIPKSVSDHELSYVDEEEREESYISTPLPVVPADEEEDEVCSDEEEVANDAGSESPVSDGPEDSPLTNKSSSYEVRQRGRAIRKENMEAKVRDMKRRQHINEQWTQLKRSLYIPLLAGGALVLGGGFLAYVYYKN